MRIYTYTVYIYILKVSVVNVVGFLLFVPYYDDECLCVFFCL